MGGTVAASAVPIDLASASYSCCKEEEEEEVEEEEEEEEEEEGGGGGARPDSMARS